MSHVRKAAAEAEFLVGGIAGARDAVADAHVVRETDPAEVLGFVAGQTNAITIAVATDIPVELIADDPGVAVDLEEQVIHGEIEGIEHPVFALIDGPKGLSIQSSQKLGGAKVAANRLAEVELLVAGERGFPDETIGIQSEGFLLVELAERINCDLLDRGE